jgi:hypothetical protein
MPTKFIKTDMDEKTADELVKDYIDDGCTATKKKQDDGLWTVEAICPDKKSESAAAAKSKKPAAKTKPSTAAQAKKQKKAAKSKKS